MARIWNQQQEADNLAKLFAGVNQAQFARDHKVPGGPSMVSQHIKARRPIGMEAAIAYASGFGVPLEKISPRLAYQAAKANLLEVAAEEGAAAAADLEAFMSEARKTRTRIPVTGPRGTEEPPKPDFESRQVTDSEWDVLQDVKLMLTEAELKDIRRRAAEVRFQYKESMRKNTQEIRPTTPGTEEK